MSETRWSMHKQEAVATGGMVSAGHRLAAQAGVEMLRRGGNAVDAAVATAWAVGVVEPWMSGAGGVGAMVVHHGGAQPVSTSACARRWPRGRTCTRCLPALGPQGQYGWPAVKDEENQVGHRSVGVPGVVAGLCLRTRGSASLPREAVMEPAIALAAGGFEADWYTSLILGLDLALIASFPPPPRSSSGRARSRRARACCCPRPTASCSATSPDAGASRPRAPTPSIAGRSRRRSPGTCARTAA